MKETRQSPADKPSAARKRDEVAGGGSQVAEHRPEAAAQSTDQVQPAPVAVPVAAEQPVQPALAATAVLPVAAATVAAESVSVAHDPAAAPTQVAGGRSQVAGSVLPAATAAATAVADAKQVPADQPVVAAPAVDAQTPVIPAAAVPAPDTPHSTPEVPAAPQQPLAKPVADKPVQQAPANNSIPSQPTDVPGKPKATAPAPTTVPDNPLQPLSAPAAATQPQPAAALDTRHPTLDTPQVTPAAPATPALQNQPVPQVRGADAAPLPQPQPGTGAARLHEAVETVHAVIRMAQSGGITQARVQLHPEELGAIDIHLRQTSDGLVARVVADAAQAAHVLRHGGDELRRALESQGLNLARFDVGTAGQDERPSAFAQGDGQPSRRGGQGSSRSGGSDITADTTIEETTTVTLPNGVLVDVLA